MITRMGKWATTFDTLIFAYVIELKMIVIGNYLNGFSANNMHGYLLQLRLPNSILDKPAIHVCFYELGCQLEMVNNGNHFAFLESITAPIYDSVDNDIQHSHTPNIISQEIDLIEVEQSPLTTSIQSHPQIPSIPKI